MASRKSSRPAAAVASATVPPVVPPAAPAAPAAIAAIAAIAPEPAAAAGSEFPKYVKGYVFQSREAQDEAGPDYADEAK